MPINGVPRDGLEFVRCVTYTINKETILKGWQKTLTEGVDFDDELFGNEDNQEELLLQSEMEALMIENGGEDGTEDSEDAEHETNVELILNPPQIEQPKKSSKVELLIF